jgi:hypothetical protein
MSIPVLTVGSLCKQREAYDRGSWNRVNHCLPPIPSIRAGFERAVAPGPIESTSLRSTMSGVAAPVGAFMSGSSPQG